MWKKGITTSAVFPMLEPAELYRYLFSFGSQVSE